MKNPEMTQQVIEEMNQERERQAKDTIRAAISNIVKNIEAIKNIEEVNAGMQKIIRETKIEYISPNIVGNLEATE